MRYFKNITVRFDEDDIELIENIKRLYRSISPVYKDITTSQVLRGGIVYLYLKLLDERNAKE